MFFIAETIFKKLLIVLIITIGLSVPFQAAYAENGTADKGIVTAALLNIRSQPDKTSKSIATLKKNDIVKIIKHTNNGWLKIEYNGLEGFIRNRKKYVNLYKQKNKQKIKRTLTGETFNAKTDIEKKIDVHTEEIKQIDNEIKSTKSEVYRFSKKETVILNGLNEIDLSLNKSRQKLSSIKKDIDLLDAEIRINNNALKDLKLVIKRNGIYIEKRLIALYRLNQLGHMNVLASSDSIYDFLSRKNGMEKILEADEKILSNHLNNLERLSDLLNRLSEQKGSKIALKTDYKNQITVIEQSKAKKRSLLSEIRSKKSLKLAAIESLKEAARELTQTVNALDQGFGSFSVTESGMNTFIAKKGMMRTPVRGRLINHFGKAKDEKFLIETFHSGIKIKTDRGEPVQAVSRGKVIFADWLKGYGNLIIIDHGEHYYSLYGHTEELFKAKGDIVQDREVIATVGDTGSLGGAGLHFEIRHKGEPVAPLKWLKKDKF